MTNQKLQIALFHLGFVYSGGGEKLVLHQALGLMKLGHKVDIFAPVVDRDACFPELLKKVSFRQMLPSLRFLPEWESLQVIIVCLIAPFIAGRYKNYDVILACNQPSAWIAFWVSLLYRVPYVTYLAQPTRFIYPRNIDVEEGLIFTKRYKMSLVSLLLRVSRPLSLLLDTKSVQASQVVFANGTYIKRLITKIYKVKARDLPAFASVSNKLIPRIRRERGSIGLTNYRIIKPYLLVTNRHFPQKRFEYALFALQSLIADHPEITLVITGGATEYTKYLVQLTAELSLTKHVVFTGLVTERELSRLYSNALIYLYTAPEEDFGMGIIEAMGAGAPVVVWDNAGPTYLVKDGFDGLKAEHTDVAHFIHQVHRLVHDIKLYSTIQKNAARSVSERYTNSAHIDILDSVLWKVAKDA